MKPKFRQQHINNSENDNNKYINNRNNRNRSRSRSISERRLKKIKESKEGISQEKQQTDLC